MSKPTLDQLTPQEKRELLNQLKNEQRANEELIQKRRAGYKAHVNKKIPGLFTLLKECNDKLSKTKERIYRDIAALVKEKSEVYDREQDQSSHTFTTDDGISITIGYRMNDGWDDTVDVGIQKVHDRIKEFGTDANSKKLVKVVLQLLSKDGAGNLKASRVLQLRKLAEETKDKSFIDAIQIIQDAYKPVRSKQFITAKYKDDKGATLELPLSISDIELVSK